MSVLWKMNFERHWLISFNATSYKYTFFHKIQSEEQKACLYKKLTEMKYSGTQIN
jgi:hypothetical protein